MKNDDNDGRVITVNSAQCHCCGEVLDCTKEDHYFVVICPCGNLGIRGATQYIYRNVQSDIFGFSEFTEYEDSDDIE